MNKKVRLDKWKKEDKLHVFFEHPINKGFQKLLDKQEDKERNLSNIEVMKLTRELIFDFRDETPIYSFNKSCF